MLRDEAGRDYFLGLILGVSLISHTHTVFLKFCPKSAVWCESHLNFVMLIIQSAFRHFEHWIFGICAAQEMQFQKI